MHLFSSSRPWTKILALGQEFVPYLDEKPPIGRVQLLQRTLWAKHITK